MGWSWRILNIGELSAAFPSSRPASVHGGVPHFPCHGPARSHRPENPQAAGRATHGRKVRSAPMVSTLTDGAEDDPLDPATCRTGRSMGWHVASFPSRIGGSALAVSVGSSGSRAARKIRLASTSAQTPGSLAHRPSSNACRSSGASLEASLNSYRPAAIEPGHRLPPSR